MNIYLDIDGVILANDIQEAKHSKEFIKYLTDNHNVYWLTTHCKGDAEYTVNFVSRYFDPETIELLKKIKPTNWDTLKTEAIDFDKPFLWFDDQLFDSEKDELDCRNLLDSWIEIDLSKNVDQLKDLIENFPSKSNG
ncbi:hypothetical protein A2W45_01675 [Candidatus Curtissbacteria bacterium RIFCSPHIGHO2_12_41_11]|uniref:FCP1 homology domain-containing protein n=3 Tax=Candidatus Curtissiibacteriota TaxID=1752717 RepID=A0A1F5HQD9_9BACT|nr:MAG: hypothetical protein UU56_C0001G0004 [Candidatus Curtissbacteria bacterium GW2011_GWA2_41_24]OGD98076.1 MAG: hypothetical protein A2W45_01675 [Candidatus Curtissbacteria bacterium RIFCSPHIGHO2_12_41_11]OGE06310.1 MAG: hypothetical protein A2W70_03675 [Candidatus Curtissbacteria bacterium RIFCSPLOWO2_02_41_11]